MANDPAAMRLEIATLREQLEANAQEKQEMLRVSAARLQELRAATSRIEQQQTDLARLTQELNATPEEQVTAVRAELNVALATTARVRGERDAACTERDALRQQLTQRKDELLAAQRELLTRSASTPAAVPGLSDFGLAELLAQNRATAAGASGAGAPARNNLGPAGEMAETLKETRKQVRAGLLKKVEGLPGLATFLRAKGKSRGLAAVEFEMELQQLFKGLGFWPVDVGAEVDPAMDAMGLDLLLPKLPRQARSAITALGSAATLTLAFDKLRGLYLTQPEVDQARLSLASIRMLKDEGVQDYHERFAQVRYVAEAYGHPFAEGTLIEFYFYGMMGHKLEHKIREHCQTKGKDTPGEVFRTLHEMQEFVVRTLCGLDLRALGRNSGGADPGHTAMEIGAVGFGDRSPSRERPSREPSRDRGGYGGQGHRGGDRGGERGRPQDRFRGRPQGRSPTPTPTPEGNWTALPLKVHGEVCFSHKRWKAYNLAPLDNKVFELRKRDRLCFVCGEKHGGRWADCPTLAGKIKVQSLGQGKKAIPNGEGSA